MTFSRMLKLMAGSFGARLIGAALGLSTQILLARNFTQSDVGTVFLTMSMASLLSLVISMGYPALALTQLPQYYNLKNNTLASAFHRASYRDSGIGLLALGVLLYLGSLVFDVREELRLAFLFGFLSAPFSAMIFYNVSVANSSRQFSVAYVFDNFVRAGTFFIVVLTLIVAGYKASITFILLSYVASNMLTAIIQYLCLGEFKYKILGSSPLKQRFNAAIRIRAASLAVVNGLAIAVADIVTFLSGLFLLPESVALVGVTIRLAAIAGFAVQSAQQLILPDLSQALTTADVPTRQNILLKNALLTSGTMLAGIIGAELFGTFVLGLLGTEYKSGLQLLVLFMVAQTIRALGGMNQYLLSIGGYQKLSSYISVASIVILSAAWMLIVPYAGLIGVGIAIILMETVSAIAYAWLAQKYIGMRGDFVSVVTGYFKS